MRTIKLLCVAICFLLIGSVTSAQTDDSCSDLQGTVQRESYDSATAGRSMFYTVYLPRCYAVSTRSYPVIYLLHGSNDDDSQWSRLGIAYQLDRAILRGQLPPVVVVMPFGDTLANSNVFDGASWGDVILNDLMPEVENRYRIDARRESRAVGGISRGGFWAFYLAFTHPELFSAVGGHSAFFSPDTVPPEDDPLELAGSASGLDTLRIWLDRGADDFAAPGLDLMDQRLRESGVAHTYRIYPAGQHDNDYWGAHLADYLQFYTSEWIDQTLTPVGIAPPPARSDQDMALFVPVVSFPSIQSDIDSQRLQAVYNGDLDPKLILDSDTADALRGFGILLHPDTRIVPADALFNRLWHERDAYTLLPFDQLTPQYRVLYVGGIHPVDSDLTAYPFAFASDTPTYRPDALTRITMSGVTAMTRNSIPPLDAHGVEWAGEAIRPYVQRADYFHTSNEVSFVSTCPQSDVELLGGNNSMCSKDAYFNLLTYLGVDVVELTGNHNNDYGFDAYRRSFQMYHDAGMATIGGGDTLEEARQPLLLDHNGNRIAMLACNWAGPYYALADDDTGRPGAAYCDWNWLNDELPRLAAANDLVIMTVQYSEYDQHTPTDQQRADFRGLARLGADVVIGTQAHLSQTFEFYDAGGGRSAFIHYGLGNLFFDQQFWGGTRFFMDTLYIYQGQLLTVDLFTGIIEDQARPRPMTPDERQAFLQFMFITKNGF